MDIGLLIVLLSRSYVSTHVFGFVHVYMAAPWLDNIRISDSASSIVATACKSATGVPFQAASGIQELWDIRATHEVQKSLKGE